MDTWKHGSVPRMLDQPSAIKTMLFTEVLRIADADHLFGWITSEHVGLQRVPRFGVAFQSLVEESEQNRLLLGDFANFTVLTNGDALFEHLAEIGFQVTRPFWPAAWVSRNSFLESTSAGWLPESGRLAVRRFPTRLCAIRSAATGLVVVRHRVYLHHA
jgi:hypothetical protein